MANRPAQASVKKRVLPRPRPAEPQALARPRSGPGRGALGALISELRALGARGGSSLGDAYARAAGSLLTRAEWLEDRNAERRFRQRASSTNAAEAHARARAGGAPAAEEVASTSKVSL